MTRPGPSACRQRPVTPRQYGPRGPGGTRAGGPRPSWGPGCCWPMIT